MERLFAPPSPETPLRWGLYERYRDPIYRYCLSRTGTAHDAEDLTSESW